MVFIQGYSHMITFLSPVPEQVPRYQVDQTGRYVVVYCRSSTSNYPIGIIDREPISVDQQLANLLEAMADMDDH
jgi:hypothetical protein